MGTVISFGIQKGGVGKTTACAITAYLLSKESTVLCLDMDSQGNLSQFLTRRDIYDFTTKTILEALKAKDAVPYIINVSNNLDLIPAEDLLSTFSRWIYTEYRGNPNTVLREMIATIKDQYDYILIDLPPNLGEQTINGLTASDFAVTVLQSEPFCYSSLERYLETLQAIQDKTNPDLTLAGILIGMSDRRTSLDQSIIEKVKEEYGGMVFDSIIKRRSRIKEFVLEGIQDNTKADREALEQYVEFVEELKKRVK
jgi:chromosome partitioning protein